MISLVMTVRDEWPWIERHVQEVLPYVQEFIFLDTGSTDGTYEELLKYGRGVQIHTDFMKTDFGQFKTAVSWMATAPYVLLLDGDERITGLENLEAVLERLDASPYKAVAFPRRRWADAEMTVQVEKEAYPDRQLRLYRNDRDLRWVGALHEVLTDSKTREAMARDGKSHWEQGHLPHLTDDRIVIEHLVDSLHLSDPIRRKNRAIQRRMLAERAGVPAEGSEEAAKRAGVME